jgi:hypothetical protein
MVATVVIFISNLLVAAGAVVIAVSGGGIWYALAAPVALTCGGAAIWQMAAIARGRR